MWYLWEVDVGSGMFGGGRESVGMEAGISSALVRSVPIGPRGGHASRSFT